MMSKRNITGAGHSTRASHLAGSTHLKTGGTFTATLRVAGTSAAVETAASGRKRTHAFAKQEQRQRQRQWLEHHHLARTMRLFMPSDSAAIYFRK